MATTSEPKPKDVDMKDVETENPKEEEPDPKQVQKDKDLLTFEGKSYKFQLMRIVVGINLKSYLLQTYVSKWSW